MFNFSLDTESSIWSVCGELNIPVLIHSADPFQFWLPKDIYNERWLELKERPNRYYAESDFIPPFEDLLAEQHDIFRKHPNTIFINAHMGWMANDLERMGKHLDEFPNVMTEFGAVIAEFGRQPKTRNMTYYTTNNTLTTNVSSTVNGETVPLTSFSKNSIRQERI